MIMKNNKAKKIIGIILICLLVAFGIYVLVSFIVNKDGTMYWINYFIDLLNKPLPIIGVTTLALLLFGWKVFVSSKYGKAKLLEYELKLKEIEQRYSDKSKELEKEHEKFVLDSNSKINELLSKNEQLRNELAKVCALSTNKKINEFGKVLENYGKEETTNSDTTKE